LKNVTPPNWKAVALSDVCDVEMGQSPPSSTYNEDGKGLPFFQGKTEFTDLYPEVRKWCSSPNKTARKNDILLSVRAPVGPTNLAPSDCCIGRGLAALSPQKGVSNRYVLYAIRALENELAKLGTGTTFEAVSGKTVRDFAIPIAPSSEQARITAKIDELFSDLDAGVAALERARANLKRYRAAVLKAAVEGKLTEQWRKEHPNVEPASKLLERILAERRRKWEEAQLAQFAAAGNTPSKGWQNRYKQPAEHEQDVLPALPFNWAWISLGMLAWQVRDGPHYSPKYAESGIPFISGGNIRPEGIDFLTAKIISEDLHRELSKRCKPEYGDLLYTKGGTTGIARINWETKHFNVWVHVAVLKLVDSIDKNYLQHALNSPYCYSQSQRYTHGVGNQDLGLTRMVRIALPLPSLAEQKEIAEEIDRRSSILKALEIELENTSKRNARLRQSILKRAFDGKLVPQDPYDLPAPRPGKWFVYALECDNRSIYIGQTRDVEERWKEHATGRGAEWTRKHPPVKLVHWEEFDLIEAAVKREKELKTGFGRKWLKREYAAGRTRQAGEPASILLERIRNARAAESSQRAHKRRTAPA